MKVVRAWEEEGVTIPPPHHRTIKVLLAPDKEGVRELTFSHSLIHAHASSSRHTHDDRPELIMIVSGRGIAVIDGKETPVQADMALWVEPGEEHQMFNTDSGTLKLLTVFVPPYTLKESYDSYHKMVEEAKRS